MNICINMDLIMIQHTRKHLISFSIELKKRKKKMLKFKLISIIEGFYYYEIYPEGKIEDKGWVIFNPKTKQLKEKLFLKVLLIALGIFFKV